MQINTRNKVPEEVNMILQKANLDFKKEFYYYILIIYFIK